MSEKSSSLKSKSLTILSAKKTPTFNLIVQNRDFGVIKQHNVIKTTTFDSKIDLTFSVLTKATKISLRMIKDEKITIAWNKIKGKFEITDNNSIILSQKSYLSTFSKVFYPLLAIFSLLTIFIVLLIVL